MIIISLNKTYEYGFTLKTSYYRIYTLLLDECEMVLKGSAVKFLFGTSYTFGYCYGLNVSPKFPVLQT